VLVAKSQGASNYNNTARKKKKFKKKTPNPKSNDICCTCGRKVIGVQHVLKKKKGSLSGDSRGRLANMAIESSQSVGDNREVRIVWIVMNNTGWVYEASFLIVEYPLTLNKNISLAILRLMMVSW